MKRSSDEFFSLKNGLLTFLHNSLYAEMYHFFLQKIKNNSWLITFLKNTQTSKGYAKGGWG